MCLFKKFRAFAPIIAPNRRGGTEDHYYVPNWKGIFITLAFLIVLLITLLAFFRYEHYLEHLHPKLTAEERSQPAIITSAFLFGKMPTSPRADLEKAEAVRRMTAIAWHGYATHALGARALRPLSRTPSDEVSHYNTGATVLEAMSTLWVLDLREEYKIARQWVLSMKVPVGGDGRHQPLYVWPLVTKYMGSLLSSYALTGDEALLVKAKEYADIVKPAFMSKDRPFNRLYINATDSMTTVAASKMGFIGEMGAMSLELRYLAHLLPSSSNETERLFWMGVVEHLRAQLGQLSHTPIYPLTYEPNSPLKRISSLANDAQHFFGYLVRSNLQTAGRDAEALKLFESALAGAKEHRLLVEHKNGSGEVHRVTVEDVNFVSRQSEGVMKVGACQLASTLALAGKQDLAEGLAETCWFMHSYVNNSSNGSGNSSDGSSNSSNGSGNSSDGSSNSSNRSGNSSNGSGNSSNSLRLHRLPASEVPLNQVADGHLNRRGLLGPDLAESYFTLWRLTKKGVWRERAWALFQAINETARVGAGFSELTDFGKWSEHTDYQPAEFVGATLKYLYLTFADFSQLPLDKWVFNAAGQPLPVCGTSSLYPKCDV